MTTAPDAAPAAALAPALEMREITKSFPGVVALDGVSFDCRPGEVHAICGENGAGKSTLMKVLGGVHRPDSGAVFLHGSPEPAAFKHPVEARRAGISIIHQELSLLPERSVAENVYLGLEPAGRAGVLDRRAMRDGARALLARLSSDLDPDARVGDLSIAERQLVEIAKALGPGAGILVLDEPTAALGDADARRLLDLLRRLRSEGVAIVYISHRMPEVLAIADRVTVLKDGRRVATLPAAGTDAAAIVRLMVGRELADFFPARTGGGAAGDVLLEVEGAGNDALDGISLTLRAGEIVGVAGLEGSGKDALAKAILGDRPFVRGAVRFRGRAGPFRRPRDAVRAGVGYVPGDRKGEGLALRQSVRDNARLTLRALAAALARPGRGALGREATDRRLAEAGVRAADYGQDIRQLSGGNQQKAIIARSLARDPAVLVFVEPTRGIDVAAKAAIYAGMREAADRGRGVLMVSSDLPEVVGVSDRVLVMRDGRIAGERPGGASEEEVMALAVGGPGPGPAAATAAATGAAA